MTYTRREFIRSGMTERHERLQRAFAEFKEGGLTPAEAVERWGWNINTVKSNLNGNAQLGYKGALKYAMALKVRPDWLFAGTDPMREPPKASRRPVQEIPVIGWVQAGQLTDVGAIHEVGEGESLILGGLPPGNWFATDVHGDSMDRVSPEGSRILVNADDRKVRPGGYYLFSLRGEATYKRFYDKPKRLEPYSTNPSNRTIFLSEDPDWTVVGRVRRSLLDLD